MLALGRGLMALPRLLMVDEPFLGLAPQVMEQMKSVFEALKAEGMAILFIEQNVRLALSMAGRGYILESGRLAIEGPAASLMNSCDQTAWHNSSLEMARSREVSRYMRA